MSRVFGGSLIFEMVGGCGSGCVGGDGRGKGWDGRLKGWDGKGSNRYVDVSGYSFEGEAFIYM